MAESEKRKRQDIGQDEAWTANLKNIFAGELDESGRDRLMFQLMAANTVATLASINNSIAKGCQQLVESEAVKTDRVWNVDEQGYTAEKILGQPFVEAINAAVAVAVANALGSKK